MNRIGNGSIGVIIYNVKTPVLCLLKIGYYLVVSRKVFVEANGNRGILSPMGNVKIILRVIFDIIKINPAFKV